MGWFGKIHRPNQFQIFAEGWVVRHPYEVRMVSRQDARGAIFKKKWHRTIPRHRIKTKVVIGLRGAAAVEDLPAMDLLKGHFG